MAEPTSGARSDGRSPRDLRPFSFRRDFVSNAPGSCLVDCGRTRVLCTATYDPGVPPWLAGRGKGWLTAEYAMLPGSTDRRKNREGRKGGGIDGRSAEIQRLIGRAFRPIVDLAALGELTIHLDCDVISADGGTRVTAINGAFVALHDLCTRLVRRGVLAKSPLRGEVGAISVGIVRDRLILDLAQQEDQAADADMNIVATGELDLIEVQATAEGAAFPLPRLVEAVELGRDGIRRILEARRAVLASPPPDLG